MSKKSILTDEEKKQKRKEAKARYREKNREVLREKNRQYRKEHPEKHKESSDNWTKNNRDKVNDRQKRYAERHPEKIKEMWDDWYQNNKERVRENKLKRIYGLTLKDYKTMLDSQEGKCLTCGDKEENQKDKVLVVDHCHKTGKVRGLLCNKCNTAIGLVRENSDTLKNIIKYLEEKKAVDESAPL